jgi:hypothetical protein
MAVVLPVWRGAWRITYDFWASSRSIDRLLIAQAQIEKLVLVTADARIKEYAVQIIET